MTGKIKTRDGILYAVINYKDNYGRYKQKWISTKLKERGNKKLAKEILEQEMEKFKNEINNENWTNINEQPKDIIFMDYVKDYLYSKSGVVSVSTFRGYENLWRHMCNFFGMNLKLKDVTYNHILDFYNHLSHERGLKNVSIKKYQELLAPALRLAYRDDLIPKNPYEFMPKLKREKRKQNFYDIDELTKLFEVTDQTELKLIVRVCAYYGFRRSELLGIRWKSIDFKRKTITIENKVLNVDKKIFTSEVLKTDSSNRTMPLLPEIEELLLQRKEEIEKNKYLYGKKYNQDYLDYVFVDNLGNLYLPDHITHLFHKIIKKNNLKHLRFHDLRHSCASILVNKNVPMKNIQDWLGHSTYNLTADTYSHLKYDNKIESANIISECFAKKEEQKPIIEEEPTIEIKAPLQTHFPKTRVDLDYEIKMLEKELEYKKQLKKKQSDFEM